MGRAPGYLFGIMNICYVIYAIYLLIWNKVYLYDNLKVYLFLFICLSSFMYLFLRFPLWIIISDKKFMPFVSQKPYEFMTRKFQWVNYDNLSHVKIYTMDGKIFRMDLKLKDSKEVKMYYLAYNPELTEAYEEVFKMKLDENAFTVIEKHSEINN